MAQKVDIDSFADAVREILTEYGDKATEAMKEAVKETSDESSKKVRSSSPSATGAYAKGWKSKVEEGRLSAHGTVYNKPHYQRVHLLENGHDIRNRKGGKVYGHVDGRKHVAPVDEWAQEEVVKRMEEKLSEADR